jgi:hypothetical protein
MEPIGFCGGGLVALVLILAGIIGLVVVAGGIVLVLAKLGVIVDRLAKPDQRGESDTYTLDQSNAPTEHNDAD